MFFILTTTILYGYKNKREKLQTIKRMSLFLNCFNTFKDIDNYSVSLFILNNDNTAKFMTET